MNLICVFVHFASFPHRLSCSNPTLGGDREMCNKRWQKIKNVLGGECSAGVFSIGRVFNQRTVLGFG